MLPQSTLPNNQQATDHRAPARRLGLWLGSLGTSLCADQVFFLALTWAALQVGSPSEVGMVVAAASLPRLAILLFGGALADRVNPRLLAAAADGGRAAAVAGTVVLVLVVDLEIWQLAVVAVVVGALDGLFMPAVGALPPLIAPAELMRRAGALRSVVQRVALLLAGPISGFVIAWSGTAAGFATAAVLFVLSTVLLLLLRSESAPSSVSSATPALDLAGGFVVVRRSAVLLWLLLLIGALNLGFAGPVTAGLPLLAAEQQWGSFGAGLLLGGFGLGAAASGLTLVVTNGVPRAGRVLLLALAAMGLAIAAFAITTSLAAAIVSAVLLGCGSGVVSSIVHGLLLVHSPAEALGRVMALVSITLEGAFPISTYLTGVVAGWQGTGVAFLGGGAILVLAAAAAATRPAIRDLETPGSRYGQECAQH